MHHAVRVASEFVVAAAAVVVPKGATRRNERARRAWRVLVGELLPQRRGRLRLGVVITQLLQIHRHNGELSRLANLEHEMRNIDL